MELCTALADVLHGAGHLVLHELAALLRAELPGLHRPPPLLRRLLVRLVRQRVAARGQLARVVGVCNIVITCDVSRPRVPTLVDAGPGVVLAGGGGHDVLGVEAVAQHQAPEPDTVAR